VNGVVYVGATTGEFYALNEATGKIIWKRFTGFQPKLTCPARGIASTPTVARDPVSHQLTVYLAAADGNLWAIDALTGSVKWKVVVNVPSTTTSDYFAWSSPTVSGSRIFVGSASNCDSPLVRGSLQSFDQVTGGHLATYFVVPAGAVGGAIWTSAAASGSSVWVTTGNADETGNQPGDSNSIVRLDAATLTVQDKWTIPGIATIDDDLGASPTLFTATLAGQPTPMVGACDKNGVFYAWRTTNLSAGPVWTQTVGNPANAGLDMCLAAASWDPTGSRLFHASNSTTVTGKAVPASVRRLDPATGTVLWQVGLASGPVLGSSSLDAGNVVAAATYSTQKGTSSACYLINASDGTILRSITLDSHAFSQPTFADHYLFVATGKSLTAWTT
jgi:outer membrane protein assembly factor BamB